MLKRFGLSEAKTVSTPADVNMKFVKDDGVSSEADQAKYHLLVGSLLYAAMATRPDISQAVGAVSKFSSQPSMAHMSAAKRILRYLKGTLNLALKFSKSDDGSLIGYSDPNWGGDTDDHHSTTGNLFMLAGGAVSWMSKRQAVVALSTCEAEYIALSQAAQEAVWLRKLLFELQVSVHPTVIMEDNQGAIAIANNPVSHSRTKHIDIRYHYVCEAVQEGAINI